MECKGAKVFIDVEEYDELREFRKNIEAGNYHYVDGFHGDENGNGETYYLPENEIIDRLTKARDKESAKDYRERNQREAQRVLELTEIYNKLVTMTSREFRKWRKEYNKGVK